jgi:dienelactone hydrolase
MPQQRAPRPRPPRRTPQERARDLQRRRRRAVAALALIVLALIAIVYSAFAGGSKTRAVVDADGHTHPAPVHHRPPRSFGAGVTTRHFVDTSRSVTIDGQAQARPLETVIYYPTLGGPKDEVVAGAAPARTGGPFPLIVFGHGFEKLPQTYQPLLERWARAGYVVAAPVFPLENEDAPGGPNESDLPNEPQDISFVMTQMIEESEHGTGPLAHLIDPREIAVSGQSDGGDAALAAAYDPKLRDSRIDAAAILSGAMIPMLGPFTFPSSGPALLAVQGTADPINKPQETYAYYDVAPRPKYLLRLNGASHLPPYTEEGPQLDLVARVTTAFFNAYLKDDQQALRELQSIGNLGAIGSLLAEP